MSNSWKSLGYVLIKNLTKDASKKHNIINGARVSFVPDKNVRIGFNSEWHWQFKSYGVLHTESSTYYPIGHVFSDTIYFGTSATFLGDSISFSTDCPAIDVPQNYYGDVWGYLIYGDKATPNITCSFNGGFVSPFNDLEITFSSNDIKNIDVQYIIKNSKVYIKEESSSNYTLYETNSNKVIIPSSFFETGNIYNIYAVITVDDDSTINIPINDISTIDTIPIVDGVYPNNSVVYGDVEFQWNYTNQSGSYQTAFDLQISADLETWSTIADHVLSNNTIFMYNLETAGELYWRVRGYNLDDQSSEWSNPLYFINNIAPEAPIITNITGNSRLTIFWSVLNQTAFEIELIDGEGNISFSSGVIASTNDNYLINYYLSSQTYTIRLRIQNIFGKFSEWTSKEYTVVSPLINPPEFSVINDINGTIISINQNENYQYYYLKRNGILIAKIEGLQYNDLFANGLMEYELIGITEDDYALSTIVLYDYKVSFTRLIDPYTRRIYDIHFRIGNQIGISINYEVDYSDNRYLGASTSVINVSNFKARRYNVNFYLKDNVDEILGKTFLFCDIYGNRDWVVCTGIAKNERRLGNEVSMNLNSVLYDEAIDYDI